MRLMLEDAIEQGIRFEPNLELQELKEKLREGGAYQNSREKLKDLEFATIQDIKKLQKASDSLQEAIDELYTLISSNRALKSLLENQAIDNTDLVNFVNDYSDYIRENYPEFFRDPEDPNSQVVNFEFMDVLLNDKAIRINFLRHLKSELKWQVPLYYQGKKELYNATKQLEQAQENLKNIQYYLKIQPLVETVMSRHDAQLRHDRARGSQPIKGPQTYNTFARIEQSDTNDLTYPKHKQKQWMYSTISTYYEDWVEKIPHSDTAKLKQATDWANAMYSIPLELIDFYSVQVVGPEGLKKLGQTPPVKDKDALYAVLMQEGSPYRAEDGALVFSGVATVEKYFKGQGYTNINFENDPEYIRIEERDAKTPISEENPYKPPIPKAEPLITKQDAIEELVERKCFQKFVTIFR